MKFLPTSLLVPLLFVCLAAAPARDTPAPKPLDHVIHLPGIAGEQHLDRQFLRGLREGGYAGTLEIFDWPGDDPGLNALFARKRNDREADKLAKKLKQMREEEPEAKIRLIAHSGGAGIATWALERLPDDVQIDQLVFVAPALSQRYDLSKALRRVNGKAYAFTSENDVIVLGAGTRMFGTIDGVKEDASGLRGFTMPDGADPKQYAKLVELPYRSEWMRHDNIGDHIGAMGRTFAAKVIAPMLDDRNPPPPPPTTRDEDAKVKTPAAPTAAGQ
jgi:pimeloyl-ACP methyl ester carboxylesterase